MDGQMLATVSTFFASQSIPIAQLGESTVMITRFQGETGVWRCIASVDEDAATFTFYSLLDVVVAPDRRAEVVELLMRATAGLTVGNFEFDYDNNDISFKTSVDVEGDRLSPALVANLVATNLMVVDHYLPAVQRVAAGDATAREAIAAVDTRYWMGEFSDLLAR